MTFLESIANLGSETIGGITQNVGGTIGDFFSAQRARINARLGINQQNLTNAQEQIEEAATQAQQASPSNGINVLGRQITNQQLLIGGGLAVGAVLLLRGN